MEVCLLCKRLFFSISVIFLLTLLSANPTQASDQETAVIQENLLEKLQSPQALFEVIVTYDEAQLERDAFNSLLKELGMTGVLYQELPMASVLATSADIQLLQQQQGIYSIYENQALVWENDASTSLTGVDDARTDRQLQKANNGAPISGKGIGVVINDSGIDGTHPDHKFGRNLVQNVMASTNLNSLSSLLPIVYVEDVINTDADSGHGTHVAGIVGGTGAQSGGLYEGVAPGASLIGYGSGAGVAIIDTIGGFDYALVNQTRYDIRVITNSWGSTGDVGTDFDPFHPINVATKRLYDRGIMTIFSAGNSGPNENTITGNYKKAPWVITVAAGTKSGELASFSSRGRENVENKITVGGETFTWADRPTVTAPGQHIISTRTLSPIGLLGTTSDIETLEPGHLPYYTTLSGTSMAAPHVAGAVALMLEINPELTPLEIKAIIEDTATEMPSYANWEVGAGYINVYEAVKQALINQ